MSSENFEYRGWRIDLQHRVGDWVAFVFPAGGMVSDKMIVRSEDEGGREAALSEARAHIDMRMHPRA